MKSIWKYLSLLLCLYTIVWGILGPVPARAILNETIRNLYFHVPMWFAMILLFTISCVYAILFLYKENKKHDMMSQGYAQVGLWMGVLGFVTGMLWAQYTWGSWWSGDVKQICSVILILVYASYFILRDSMPSEDKSARVAAVFNIFAYACVFPLLFIIPNVADSLHPGNGGNPAFKQYDLDANMRLVFYPAVIAWCAIGVWISQLTYRILFLKNKHLWA